jgi:IS1 family transposase/transposase-like protein
MDDLSRFCCQNPQCPDHGKRDAHNLTVTARYGPGQQRRMLRCRTCKARFSERKGTVFFHAKLPAEKVGSILEHLSERCGVRATGRLCHVNRATVGRYAALAGGHARDLHEELVAFSPRTREVQFDEKWSFVFRKQKRCDPADQRRGDCWDHVAFDPEHRLVVGVVVGKRNAQETREVVGDFHRRTGGRPMDLITTDAYDAYEDAILRTYGQTVTPPRTGRPGRPRKPYQVAPAGLTYATLRKRRERGRVVEILYRVIFGTMAAVLAALGRSGVSRAINTAFVERHHATDRHRNARKVRRTYCFSKDWDVHRSMTYFTMYSYNFCCPVRTLRVRDEHGHWQKRSPAMAAALADHIWTMSEWLMLPTVQRC